MSKKSKLEKEFLLKRDNEYFYITGSGKKYENKTNKEGYETLREFINVNLENCREYFYSKYNEDDEKIGKDIYEKKSNLSNGSTWSELEYDNEKFIYYYVKMKSIQRFTEAYNAFQKVLETNLYKDIFSKKELKIVSIAGGPGFELIAAKYLIKKIDPSIKITLHSYDLSEKWQPYLEINGIEYKKFDIDNLESKEISADIYIISYFWSMYMSRDEKLNKKLLDKLNFRNFALILERKSKQYLKYIKNYYLLDKNSARQFVISKKLIKKERKSDFLYPDYI